VKKKEEVSASAEEITAPALAKLESSALPRGIELSDDESEDLIAPVAATATSAGPSEAGPSAPRVTAVPNTSGDWEFTRKLFVELNQEAIGIPDDGALVDLVSDDEEAMEDDTCEGKKVTPDDKVEEGTTTIDGSPEQAVVPPSPPPSA
jgi:hypothetical protein